MRCPDCERRLYRFALADGTPAGQCQGCGVSYYWQRTPRVWPETLGAILISVGAGVTSWADPASGAMMMSLMFLMVLAMAAVA